MKRNKLVIYACGGAGINNAKPLIKLIQNDNPGHAEIELVFVDTSTSNISSGAIPEANTFIIENKEGKEGSGKVRKTNYEAIVEKSIPIIHKHRPGDFNIVLHSATGGSGSIAGPVIMSCLLQKGHPAVSIIIGGSSSKLEIENCINTLKSYEGISKTSDKPVVAVYRENSETMPRSKIDNDVQLMVFLLSALFSGLNEELDNQDLSNFINFHNVTDNKPRFCALDIYSKKIVLEGNESLIALTTLYDDQTSSESNILVQYQATGVISPECKKNIDVELPIHAGIISGHFPAVIKRLEAKLAAYAELKEVTKQDNLIGDTSEATELGIFL